MIPDSARLIAFLATTDAERAEPFYRDTLGLTLAEESPFALVFDDRGTTIRMQKVERFTPHPFTVLGWQVDDIDAAVARLAARGVAFERFAGVAQDAAGIWQAPGGARVAWFKDPDGNVLSLTGFGAAS